MRKFLLVFVGANLVGIASAQIVVDNGGFQTHANGGFNNAPRSVLQNATLSLNDFGFGCQKVNGNRLADDFTVPAGAALRLTGFRFYAYQNTATTNTISDANVRVWNGSPNGAGSVIAGDPITNLFQSGASTGVYRVDDLPGGAVGSSRLIMEIRANFALPPVLASGTYWTDWQLGGSLPSGPWQVPVTILGQTAKAGANGLQFLGGGGGWQSAADTSGPVQDLAFKVIGSWIIHPVTYTVTQGLAFGGNVASLAVSDNNRAIILMDDFDSNSLAEMTAISPSSTASVLTFRVEWRATRNDLSQFLRVQNVSNTFEQIDFAVSSLTDVTRTTIIASNPQRFIRPGNVIVSRVQTFPNQDVDASDGWSHMLDLVEFEIAP